MRTVKEIRKMISDLEVKARKLMDQGRASDAYIYYSAIYVKALKWVLNEEDEVEVNK